MKTSVPQVTPLKDVMLELANTVRSALDHYKATRDKSRLKAAVAEARKLYDGEMKLAANKGWLNHEHVDQIRDVLEKLERLEGLRQ